MIPYFSWSRVDPPAPSAAIESLANDLRRDVEMLASEIGPRGTYDPQRMEFTVSFLDAVLKRAGYTVRHQVYDANGVPSTNLEATLTGTTQPERVIVLGAHYDSVEGCPAANDNASGVAGVLAAARALAGKPARCTIRFVFFANEEPPHFNLNQMGSQHYARQCRKEHQDIRAMVCLETIGCYFTHARSQRWPKHPLAWLLPSRGDFIAFVGTTPSRKLVRRSARTFRRVCRFPLLATAVPERIDVALWSDHRGFCEAGYPAFMVTDTAPFRYAHYHLPSDTAEKLDYLNMARVVSGVIEMTRALADEL